MIRDRYIDWITRRKIRGLVESIFRARHGDDNSPIRKANRPRDGPHLRNSRGSLAELIGPPTAPCGREGTANGRLLPRLPEIPRPRVGDILSSARRSTRSDAVYLALFRATRAEKRPTSPKGIFPYGSPRHERGDRFLRDQAKNILPRWNPRRTSISCHTVWKRGSRIHRGGPRRAAADPPTLPRTAASRVNPDETLSSAQISFSPFLRDQQGQSVSSLSLEANRGSHGTRPRDRKWKPRSSCTAPTCVSF
jgi:hypothetical protein